MMVKVCSNDIKDNILYVCYKCKNNNCMLEIMSFGVREIHILKVCDYHNHKGNLNIN